MADEKRIAFVASNAEIALDAQARLAARYGNVPIDEAEVIVALGGDGFMLHTLHDTQELPAPVYGMNCGTIGFLMNEYAEDDLLARLDEAELAEINPLRMRAEGEDGMIRQALAINEVSLLRAGPQAAQLLLDVVEGLDHVLFGVLEDAVGRHGGRSLLRVMNESRGKG